MDDIDFITDEVEQIQKGQTKKGHKRDTKTVKHIKVRGSVEVARDNKKAAIKLHRKNIKDLKRSIHAHKLMIKQAKIAYKIVKLNANEKHWWSR